jgi:hypothetical protein
MSKEIEAKATKILEIHEQIRKIRKKGIRESDLLDELKDRLCVLGSHITHLMVEERDRIQNPLMDYCMRNLDVKDYEKFLSQKNRLELFQKQVAEFKGERIFSTNLELGVISGPSFFDIDRTFRNLYVPVKELLVFSKRRWEVGKLEYASGKHIRVSDRMHITPDIFTSPSILCSLMSEDSCIWSTDHSGEIYIGGSVPGETSIYIGNKTVERALKDAAYTIPAVKEREKKLPMPEL